MAAEDRPLIIGLKRGDMSAFESLFEKYRRAIFAYVRGILNDDALSEDCVQEVFLELARKADTIDISRGVNGWLFRVARNKSIDLLRKRSRELQTEKQDLREDPGMRPDQQMLVDETHGDLRRAIADLKESEQEIVMLRFFGGLTFAEAEEVTGVPLNTLIWRCRQALDKLGKKVKKIEDSG